MKVTLVLTALIVAGFAAELAAEGPGGNRAVEQGAFAPARALSAPWTWATSMFLHGDMLHIFFNLFALLSFGPALEGALGPRRYLLVYFAGGLAGNLGYMLTAPSALTPGLGASGAIYGIMGCLAVLAPRMEVYIMFSPVPVPLMVAAVFWALLEYLGLFAPGTIAHGAHLGGLFTGVAYGFSIRQRARREGNLFEHA